MKIVLERIGEPFHLEAVNEQGKKLEIDAAEAIGGTGEGWRPMQTVLSGLGGCASIDVLLILQKQKQRIETFRVEISAERSEEVPKVFTSINLNFILSGDVSPGKVEKALELSMEKYCSVAQMLNKTATIDYQFEIV